MLLGNMSLNVDVKKHFLCFMAIIHTAHNLTFLNFLRNSH